MAIELDCASVIVPIDSLEARYPGGVAAYRDDCPNNSYLQDEHLTRVGFMSTTEAVRYLGQVASKGLRVTDDPSASDVVLINGRDSNPTCIWLEYGGHGGAVACWLRGHPPGELVRWGNVRSIDAPPRA